MRSCSVRWSAFSMVRNKSPHIRDMVERVLNQDVPPSRVTVLDDSSTDGTAEILESMDVKLVRGSRGGRDGLLESSRHGVDYVMCIGGDTIIPRDYVGKIVTRMRRDGAVLACGLDPSRSFNHPPESPCIMDARWLDESWHCGMPMNTHVLAMRASLSGYRSAVYSDVPVAYLRKMGANCTRRHEYAEGKLLRRAGFPWWYAAVLCAKRRAAPLLAGYCSAKRGNVKHDIMWSRRYAKDTIFKKLGMRRLILDKGGGAFFVNPYRPRAARTDLRGKVRAAVRRMRAHRDARKTKRAGTLPDFAIIGAQKAGTTSLYNYCILHPDVAPSLAKEVDYFTDNYSKGKRWYVSHFASESARRRHQKRTGRPLLCLDASPNYLFFPCAPRRTKLLLPDAKLIVILRDPVYRAYSHYWHHVRGRAEPLSFPDAVRAEPKRCAGSGAWGGDASLPQHRMNSRYSYVSRGEYYTHLTRWFKCYPKERFLITTTERLRAEPGLVMDELFEFAGAGRHAVPVGTVHNDGGKYPPMDESIRRELAEHYEPHNEKLYSLIGRDLGWETK